MSRSSSAVVFSVFVAMLLSCLVPGSAGELEFSEIAKRVSSDLGPTDSLGYSVAIDGDTMVVGALNASGPPSVSGAAYIFERNQGGVDAWQEVAKLTSSDAQSNDDFGVSVDIWGDFVVVGARESSQGGDRRGAAYVFERNTGGIDTWGEVAKLVASDAADVDSFGDAVGIHGDTVIVGAPNANAPAGDSGAVYVFGRNNGGADAWGEVAKLSGPSTFSYFGNSVAIDGGTIVVGSEHDGTIHLHERNHGGADNWGEVVVLTGSSSSTHRFGSSVSIFGDTVVTGGRSTTLPGAAWVFDRNHGGSDNWGEVRRITASDGTAIDSFGAAVSISGDRLLVGARQGDTAGTDAGAAYLFERNEGGADNWGETQQILPHDPTDYSYFGWSTAIDGSTTVVAAPSSGGGAAYIFAACGGGASEWYETAKTVASDASSDVYLGYDVAVDGATVVLGAPNENYSGAAYVFARNHGGADSWGDVAKLVSSDIANADRLGHAVAISGDTVVVGAPDKSEVDGSTGAAYVFERNQGGADNWGQVTKLAASDSGQDWYFGVAVAISGDTIVVGARGENSLGYANGAAYVFQRNQGGADNWGEVVKIMGSDTSPDDHFGWAVAIKGDHIVVGSKYNYNGPWETGSAYVFARNQGGANNWGEVAILNASDPQSWVEFGTSVAIDGDTVVVGADDDPLGGSSRGSAYIFRRNQGGADNWGQVKKIAASNPIDYAFFGVSVSVEGDRVAVGADGGGSGTTGGLVYIFERNVGGEDNWGEVQWLRSPETVTNDSFGWAVDLSGGAVVTGDHDNNHSGFTGPGAGFVYSMGCPEFDFGDAEDPSFPTLLASDGARHRLGGGVYMGAAVDIDLDGQPSPDALGDDTDTEGDDEDGVTFTHTLLNGHSVGVDVEASAACLINAWIDFENDGDWDGAGEQIFTDHALAAGLNSLSFTVSGDAAAGESVVARFRVSSAGGLTFAGEAHDGEVEDYLVDLEELDYGDAPDPAFPTLFASDGARHVLGGSLFLGSLVDGDHDGQPTAGADGDDLDGTDDEDGVSFPVSLTVGTNADIIVTSTAAGLLSAWADFNSDDDWTDPGEQIFTDEALVAGDNPLSFPVPSATVPGTLFTRFRVDTGGGLSPTGLAADGEVEDHTVVVVKFDYGDAPDPSYPTLDASGGAAHIFGSGLYLGASVDAELDGQPSAGADGDDLDGTDDEDGVVFTSALRLGLDASVQVEASLAGLLNAWIDFNADGDWDDPGEQIFTDTALTAGTNNLSVAVPIDATLGATFARFRFDSAGGLTPTGAAADGEVEDHALTIEPSAELGVNIGDSPDPVRQGRRLTYSVAVDNNGGLDATGVVLTDTLDGNVSFVSANLPACSETGGVVTCSLDTLSAGTSAMVFIEVDVNATFAGTLTNTAAVALNEEDPVPANNTDTETTTAVAPGPHIFSDGFETGNTTRWSSTTGG